VQETPKAVLSLCRCDLNAYPLMASVCQKGTSFPSGQLSRLEASIRKPGTYTAGVARLAPRKGKYGKLPDALIRAVTIQENACHAKC